MWRKTPFWPANEVTKRKKKMGEVTKREGGEEDPHLESKLTEDEEELEVKAERLSPRLAHNLELTVNEVKLEENMWDALIFVYTEVAGSWGSVFFALLFVTNTFLQVTFVYIIWYGLLDVGVGNSQVEDLKWWRLHTVSVHSSLRTKAPLRLRSLDSSLRAHVYRRRL